MPRRIRPTHYMTVRRYGPVECDNDADCPDGFTCEDGVCVDELGEPIEDDQVVLSEVPVRYDPNADTVRDEQGAVVRRMPAVTAAGDYVNQIQETDDVDLKAIADGGQDYKNLDVRSVDPVHGRRAQPTRTTIGLEG